LLTKIIKF